MADALCGPSNSLQTFKQFSQVDRSLQQDRLVGSRAPSQGFRTQDPRTGSLDADFHAFENATASPFQEPFVGNNFVGQPQFQHPAPSGWANDFQNLSVSDHPVPAQQFRNYAPMVKTTNGGWHNEFMRQQQGERSSIAHGKQVAFERPSQAGFAPLLQNGNAFAPMSSFATATNMQQFSEVSHPQVIDQTSNADWSQAFEEAFQDAFNSTDQMEQVGTAQEFSTHLQESIPVEDHQAEVQQAEQIKIGSDAINYTEMKDRTVEQETQDASALARVAGELLHNVQHDSSEKFQNSQFLDLMRKIRDRQVEVRNNDFETTGRDTSEILAQPTQSAASITEHTIRNEADPNQDSDHFAFPNMDTIYAPRPADFVDYTFDDDQFPRQPRTQMSDLHPGGKYYPEQSPPGTSARMSGAVNTGQSTHSISADDFDAAHDESRGLAGRYQRNAA